MATWQKAKNFPGVRFREHPTRKHGIKKDQYFTIRYKVPTGEKNDKGQDIKKAAEEVVGWASEGWTVKTVYDLLSELRKNHKAGQRPYTLKEKRELEEERRAEEQAEQEQAEREAVTFDKFWTDTYFPMSKTGKKKRSWQAEEGLYKNWIKAVLEDVPVKDVTPFHCERIKRAMIEAEKAPRSVQYAMATVRQVWNLARKKGLVSAPSPTTEIKIQKADNRRIRFLTREEAKALLEKLQARNPQLHRIALIALHCGLRAGEIFNLTWGDIDVDQGIMMLRNTKSGRTRAAFMTEAVKRMFQEMMPGSREELVFTDRNGKRLVEVSNTFQRIVDELKLNEGVEDPRQKVVFHSLRHTYASWLVSNGTDLFTVKELMGHGQISMTERYSHLSESHLKNAVRNLEAGMKPAGDVIVLKK